MDTRKWLILSGILILIAGLYLSGSIHTIIDWFGGDPSLDKTLSTIGTIATAISPWIIKFSVTSGRD